MLEIKLFMDNDTDYTATSVGMHHGLDFYQIEEKIKEYQLSIYDTLSKGQNYIFLPKMIVNIQKFQAIVLQNRGKKIRTQNEMD